VNQVVLRESTAVYSFLLISKGNNIMKKLIILLALFSINAYAKPVNVNTADAKTLTESLQGIGQKKAEAIIQYRTEKGDFSTLSDLTNVKGIGEKTVEKNAEDILFSEGGSS
jgi:competence protein ComEA